MLSITHLPKHLEMDISSPLHPVFVMLITALGLMLLSPGSSCAQPNLHILDNGRVGINTSTMVDAADLTVKSLNTTLYGGMYVESPDAATGRPFYGYATNGTARAWHYFEEFSNTWRLYLNGERLTVRTDGRVGVNTVNPHGSALLHLNSTEYGFLPPVMSMSQRTAIANPAEGLVVYDYTDSTMYVYSKDAWRNFQTPWVASDSPLGIGYNTGGVGIGTDPQIFDKLSVRGGLRPWTANFIADGDIDAFVKVGVRGEADSLGTVARYGVQGFAIASSSNTSSTYGVYGSGQANSSNADVFGVYGTTIGSGIGNSYAIYGNAGSGGPGESWAGYFNGDAKVSNNFYVGDKVEISPTGFASAPEILIRDNDGTPTIVMHGNQSTGQGAQIYMSDENGDVTLVLDSEYASHGGGGLFILRDENASSRVIIEAKEASTQGAAMHMYNSTGTKSIELDADYGGTGIGLVVANQLDFEEARDRFAIINGLDASLTSDGYLQLGVASGWNLLLDDNEILARDNGEGSTLYIQRDTGNLHLCSLDKGDVEIGTGIKLRPKGSNARPEIELYDNTNKTVSLRGYEGGGGGEVVFFDESSGVTMEVKGTDGAYSSALRMYDLSGSLSVLLQGQHPVEGGGKATVYNDAGQATIEMYGDLDGDGRVITDELEIKGGSDLAEYFDVDAGTGRPAPGMVVSINPDVPGKLEITSKARDTKVVGVISGANGIEPGMMMGQQGSIAYGGYPVAIAGRVFVRVDESQGKIRPGDFLTSSPESGYAMRVKKFRKAQGAILGKALTTADDKGFVLMLVNLR